jgi:hypothetical protein
MPRQRTISNNGTVEQAIRYEDDLATVYATLAERQTYCDTLDGKLNGNVCVYTKKFTEEFSFDFVYRRGEILTISGVTTNASNTRIKADYDFDFKENDTIYLADGAKLGKIEGTPETKYLNQKNNRRSSYSPKMWYINVS